jgi:hypothetical protein
MTTPFLNAASVYYSFLLTHEKTNFKTNFKNKLMNCLITAHQVTAHQGFEQYRCDNLADLLLQMTSPKT